MSPDRFLLIRAEIAESAANSRLKRPNRDAEKVSLARVCESDYSEYARRNVVFVLNIWAIRSVPLIGLIVGTRIAYYGSVNSQVCATEAPSPAGSCLPFATYELTIGLAITLASVAGLVYSFLRQRSIERRVAD